MDDYPDDLYFGIGVSYGTGGFKANAHVGINHHLGNDFTGSYGFGVTYHEDFYETGSSGFEFRNSLLLNYDDGHSGASLGTNFWNGSGEMKEFDQRTGMVNFRSGKFKFSYENDGTPFQYLFLSDRLSDSFRTAGGSIGYGELSANMNLFTGLRGKVSFDEENKLDKEAGVDGGIPEGKGVFGEFYAHGFVEEIGTKYRYGGLTLNYRGISAGVNSEWIRHGFQNVFAHHMIKPQRQFPMLNDDWNPVFNISNQGTSKFTIWGQ